MNKKGSGEVYTTLHFLFLYHEAIMKIAFYYNLVLEAVDRSRDASYTIDKCLAAECVDRHDRSMAQQSTEVNIVAHLRQSSSG